MPRSRSFTRFTMRVGFEHFGQSVLFCVSMTFLRSPVLAIFAMVSLPENSKNLAYPETRKCVKRTSLSISRCGLKVCAEQEGWMAGAGYCSSTRIHDFRALPAAHIREESVASFGADGLSGVDDGCDCGEAAGGCCCGCCCGGTCAG